MVVLQLSWLSNFTQIIKVQLVSTFELEYMYKCIVVNV